jgi:hypothetical protein
VPRALRDSVRPRRPLGASARPFNFTVSLTRKSREFEVSTQIWRYWCQIRNYQNSKFLLQRSRKAPIKRGAWIDRLCGFG